MITATPAESMAREIMLTGISPVPGFDWPEAALELPEETAPVSDEPLSPITGA